MNKVIFPGSFDPFHNGHMDLVKEASKIFDEVVIVVGNNPSKNNYWFSDLERKKLIEKCVKSITNVKVIIGGKRLIEDLCHDYQIFNVFRGVKSGRTLNEELRLKMVTNYMSKLKYNEEIDFIYSISSDSDFRGSSIIKQYAKQKKIISSLVPKEILNDIIQRYKEVNNL